MLCTHQTLTCFTYNSQAQHTLLIEPLSRARCYPSLQAAATHADGARTFDICQVPAELCIYKERIDMTHWPSDALEEPAALSSGAWYSGITLSHAHNVYFAMPERHNVSLMSYMSIMTHFPHGTIKNNSYLSR
jgi:hypothetical protein